MDNWTGKRVSKDGREGEVIQHFESRDRQLTVQMDDPEIRTDGKTKTKLVEYWRIEDLDDIQP